MADIPAEALSTLQQIVFGTQIARHIEDEPPADIVRAVRECVWDNLNAYLLTGDWPDRPRTLEEVEEEYREWDADKLRAELAKQAFATQGPPAELPPATKPRRRKARA